MSTLQYAQDKLLLACRDLSAKSSEDVDLMSKVVFALFNQDLVKVWKLTSALRPRYCIDLLTTQNNSI